MVDDLAAAVRAYRQALERVDSAERALNAVRAEVPQVREQLYATIVRAAQQGVRQNEIVAITGYNRETVRRIVRAGGVEAP